MPKQKKFKVYRKLYPKCRRFARREYVDGFELEPLDKGYYNGYVDGVKAMARVLNSLAMGRKWVSSIVELVLGKPTLV